MCYWYQNENLSQSLDVTKSNVGFFKVRFQITTRKTLDFEEFERRNDGLTMGITWSKVLVFRYIDDVHEEF